MQRLVALVVTGFLAAFAVDGALSVFDELLALATGTHWVKYPRALSSTLVMLANLAMFVGMAVSPAVPKRLVLPPMAVGLWFLLGAMPLPIYLGIAGSGLPIALVQASVAAALWAYVRVRGGGWAVPEAWCEGPGFSGKHLVAVAAVSLLLSPLIGVYSAASLKLALHHGTAGYADLDRQGLLLTGRTFAKGDKRIELVGMMHIGEPAAYEQIWASFPPGSVLLAEGVSDEQELFGKRKLSYDKGAGKLGLVSQARIPIEGDDLTVRSADIDISQFSEPTRDLLKGAAKIWAADTQLEFVAAYTEVLDTSGDPAVIDAVVADVLDRRNEHLIAEVDQALGEFDSIVVPWGALHMPFLDAEVRKRGFEPVESRSIRLFRFGTVLSGVRSFLGG
jgi:hypothetical protein